MTRVSQAVTADIALAISLALVVWEILRYRLEGGRARVRMNAGLLTDYSLAQSGRSWSHLADMTKDQGGWPLEVAVIEVENPSRTPITIGEVSLDFGRTGLFHLGRYRVSPRHLEGHGAVTGATKRLEPFDRCIFIFDVWQVLQPRGAASVVPERPLDLRASVRVAGRRRLTRSPWWKRWPVAPGQVSFISGEVEIGLAAHQVLTRWLRDAPAMVQVGIIPMALEVRERYPRTGAPPSKDELREIIDAHVHTEDEYPLSGVAALYGADDLALHYPGQQSETATPTHTADGETASTEPVRPV